MARRLTHDKRRAELYQRWIDHLPAEEVARKLQASREARAEASTAEPWSFLGPHNIGGRLTCLAVDPLNPKALWVGAAGGGVWYTADAEAFGTGEAVWEARWNDCEATLNIGSLVVDPSNPNILYCGTGEANLSLDSNPGVGVFRTEDGGGSWDWVASADARSAAVPVPRHIGSMAIDEARPDTIWLAGLRTDDSEPLGGVYHSTDHGRTWQRHELPGFEDDESYQAHAVLALDGEILAGITTESEHADQRAGLWHSTDGGTQWSQVWWPGEDVVVGRIALARCAAHPERVYALVANELEAVEAILLSPDGGKSWVGVDSEFPWDDTMIYTCSLAVHPTDPDRIIFGGIDLFESRDRGGNWSRRTFWTAKRGAPYYAHADHHALAWIEDGHEGTILYDGNDGGLDLSLDGAKSFLNRSTNLPVTQFYDVEVAGSGGEILGGGSQDNGTMLDPGTGVFEIVAYGDGGWLALGSDGDPDRWVAAALTFPGFRLTSKPGVDEAVRDRDLAHPAGGFDFWVIPVEIHPERPDVVFTASDVIYVSVDFGASWQPVTGSLDGTAVTAVRVSSADPDRVYASTAGGRIFRSDDGGFTWSYDLVGLRFGGLGVVDLCCSCKNRDELFVCLGGWDEDRSRIHHSTDGGWTWEQIPEGDLPKTPLQAIALGEPEEGPRILAVAGEVGVWKQEAAQGPFTDVTGNLPRAKVTDLVWHAENNSWTVATYGRGLWRANAL